jgi:hypothetical protein
MRALHNSEAAVEVLESSLTAKLTTYKMLAHFRQSPVHIAMTCSCIFNWLMLHLHQCCSMPGKLTTLLYGCADALAPAEAEPSWLSSGCCVKSSPTSSLSSKRLRISHPSE